MHALPKGDWHWKSALYWPHAHQYSGLQLQRERCWFRNVIRRTTALVFPLVAPMQKINIGRCCLCTLLVHCSRRSRSVYKHLLYTQDTSSAIHSYVVYFIHWRTAGLDCQTVGNFDTLVVWGERSCLFVTIRPWLAGTWVLGYLVSSFGGTVGQQWELESFLH